ncbi:MAG: CHAT domain-containing protein [Cyanobacteria bacterium P01_H01_bin.153]
MYRLLHRLLKRQLRYLLFCGGLIGVLAIAHPQPNGWLGAPAAAQAQRPAQLVQTGVEAYQQGEYAAAIAIWSQALTVYPEDAVAERAIVHENMARAQQQMGETQAEIAAWAAAAAAYEASGNPTQFGRMLTEQAQVYIRLGQHQRAAALLCGDQKSAAAAPLQCAGGAYAIAVSTDDAVGKVAAIGSLAEAYRLTGDYETALAALAIGLEQIQAQGQLAAFEAPLLNSLGNTQARLARVKRQRAEAAELLNLNNRQRNVVGRLKAEAAAHRQAALQAFSQAVGAASRQADHPTELRSRLSQLILATTSDEAFDAIRERLAQLISELPASRETAYAAIALAKSYRADRQSVTCPSAAASEQYSPPQLIDWLQVGLQIADQINDDRARSFALGELGHVAECQQDWALALPFTNRAQQAASDALESADSLYLWEWQMARLYKAQGQLDKAMDFYRQAIATLEGIRTDLLTANRDLQFDFRDTVEPIYRQYIALQLAAAADEVAAKQLAAPPNFNVTETLQTVDALRLAELQNFFGDDCVIVAANDAPTRLLANDPHTAIVTSVVLPEYTALIATLPDGTEQIVRVEDSTALKAIATDFRATLTRFTDRVFDLSAASTLYQQFMAPLEAEFARTQTETLVFVQDGFLRNIPMAALYDGEQYLVQKYAVATTPALSLTAPPSPSKAWRALAVGLSQEIVTESGYEFDDLRSVPQELAQVAETLPGSKRLLNEEFTIENFQAALKEARYTVLHLATHGQFSTVPDETFVITGPNATGKADEITFNQLEALIRESSPNAEPVDLITLTACETATGDDRSTLGLAGVAVQAGARSAIASLWPVDDATAATLIASFYSNLQAHQSKAQALRNAQIEVINNNPGDNPGHWAPLILVGNWQ